MERPLARRSAARRRRALARLALGALLVGVAAFFVSAQEDAPATAPQAAQLDAHLKGVDLARPAQIAFRFWPPPEIVERLYRLPWTSMSFRRAALFRRPIFMVMTVSWNRLSQRMVQETLADPKVLRAVNDGYVTVLVSADRRPDIRERYQTGTWPVAAFLLPDGNPILSQANPQGVALPITFGFVEPDRMLFFLEQGQIYWAKWSNLLLGVGEIWAGREGGIAEPRQEGKVAEEASDALTRWLLGNFDAQNGGFEAAPKFVIGGLAEYAALREARLVPALAKPAATTLEKLVQGPLYDRREGGVHRLAAVPNWRLIQYEKMLEGNAELVRDLTFALRRMESEDLRAALRDTSRFVTTVLARPGGGFYLAQGPDPTTLDGGGYWNAAERPKESPPVERLVLAGPNAMAGAALLRAGAHLGEEALMQAGRQALDLVLERGYQAGRGVGHVLEPFPEPFRFLWSQADAAFALTDAYESTGDPRYLKAARDIADFCVNNLLVKGEQAFRDRLADAVPIGLLANPRHPATANARLARAMVRLALHGQGEAYRDRARAVLETYVGDLVAYKTHGVELALGVEELIRDPLVIRIEGDPRNPATQALRKAALGAGWPWTLVSTGGAEGAPAAHLAYGDVQRRVTDPESLRREALAMTPHPEPAKP